jgi:hypothetical protein
VLSRHGPRAGQGAGSLGVGSSAAETHSFPTRQAGRFLTGETVAITELEPIPKDGRCSVFIGKSICQDNSISDYPKVTWWKQSVSEIPATVYDLFEYLREARRRNICLIRGAPANINRLPTRRWNVRLLGADGKDRGDHGFLEVPTRLFWLDVDGFLTPWRKHPQRAMRAIVNALGQPFASTSFVWFFSATHGLERDEHKRWTGNISEDNVRVRLGFITERPLNESEAIALSALAKLKVPAIDLAASRLVQPNYIKRPLWLINPHLDPLGEVATLGWIGGKHDRLAVLDDLTHKARWAKAQGQHHGGGAKAEAQGQHCGGAEIASHPDAESAVRAIGSDGAVRPHLMDAVRHLLRAHPPPDIRSFYDHAAAIVDEVRELIEQHREAIVGNLVRHGRSEHAVDALLAHINPSWARWLLNHPSALRRKTVKLIKDSDNVTTLASANTIYERVDRTVERACFGEIDPFAQLAHKETGTAPVELLIAPTGARKSTLMREAAVRFVQEHPDQSVVIFMPRHRLGDEQIKLLHKEHPNADFSAAIWRGRQALDPDADGQQMCQRPDEAQAVQDALLNVEHALCKQGRGRKAVKCPLYNICGYQRQKQVVANIWFMPHEMLTQKPLKLFGDIGLVMIDESPLDAFMFGLDRNDQVMFGLDLLREPPNNGDRLLSDGREALYRALHPLVVPSDRHLSVPATRACLHEFPERTLIIRMRRRRKIRMSDYDARHLARREWRNKVKAKIRPTMSAKQVEQALLTAAVSNPLVKHHATLFETVADFTKADPAFERCGRIQVHRGAKGREIRMVGLQPIAKGWRKVRALICDATGDPVLLRAIWPQLQCEQDSWEQLPRPECVRVLQMIDRTFSKYAVAVEGKNAKELARKQAAARRMYAALLVRALEYGGQPVAAIMYKSTRTWVEANCFVPDWLTLLHHGDVTGTNEIRYVRALFVVGRPLPAPEDITRQAEALFGEYIAPRDYKQTTGRIPIVPDCAGNTAVEVEGLWRHQHPIGERLRRQACEGALIQAAGRARAGLRGPNEPLDLHLWTDIPLSELGRVVPVLKDELEDGLDAQMLAAGGVWLECAPDAAEAYPALFKLEALKRDRERRGGTTLLIGILISNVVSPRLLRVTYKRVGKGRRRARAVTLLARDQVRGWLEARLGPLVLCEVEGETAATIGGG